VLTPTPYGFPWIAKLIGDAFYWQPDGAVFTLQGGDIPYVLAHFNHQSRRVRFEVFEAGSGRSAGLAFDDLEYMPRNSGATSFFAFTWDGMVLKGQSAAPVPDGDYVLQVQVQKAGVAFADPSQLTPGDFEVWSSTVIRIDRP
jgi:hypothetical protein